MRAAGAHRIAIQAALAHLEETRGHDRAEYGGVYDDLAQHYRQRLEALTGAPDGAGGATPLHYHKHRAVTLELLRVQPRTLLNLRRDGRIDDQVLRGLEPTWICRRREKVRRKPGRVVAVR